MFRRILYTLLVVALGAGSAPAEDAASGRLWDWRLAKDPPRVLSAIQGEPPLPQSILLVLEPTPLAATFWTKLAAPPVPKRMPMTAVWLMGRGVSDIRCVRRDVFASKLTAIRTVKTAPTRPVMQTLTDAIRWAEENLPAPRSLMLVTTRFEFARKGLERVIQQAKAAQSRISIVCPEAAFSDNANLLMHVAAPVGEAPMEEVAFDWDLNLPGLWLARVRWTTAQAELIPDDVRADPWRGLPFVRTRGYGFVPSGFAGYAVSRLAHATGGSVFLHGYRAAPKARCTYEMDPGLYRPLAPSVQPARAYRKWRAKDPIARIHDRSLAILAQSPGVLARNPRRERSDGSIKGFKPLPTRFDSDGDVRDALSLAKRKDALARKALLHLSRIDGTTGKAADSPRFRAHCVLLMAWLQRVRFHLGQYMLTMKHLRTEDRLASGVYAAIKPKVLWKFCYGVRGASQRTLGYRPAPASTISWRSSSSPRCAWDADTATPPGKPARSLASC